MIRRKPSPLTPRRRPALGAALAAFGLAASLLAPSTSSAALPDHRGYELVSRYAENGIEVGLSGVAPFFTAAATDGESVDWQAAGACCGATTGEVTLYQSKRSPTGWQTKPMTPPPSEPLRGLLAEQAPVFWSTSLDQTIFSTSASYAPGDRRPKGSGATDLYLQGRTGTLTWLSQGPVGTGTSPYPARFDAASPDLGQVIFSSAEPLTANATGLASENTAEYLYARDVTAATTNLVDVTSGGNPITPFGARLGNDGPPKEGLFSFAPTGTITHAVSENGSKVFFETPPEGLSSLPEGLEPHLYMRDLTTETTTPIDNPESTGTAQYEGASTNGSLVLFTSNEGLGGASTANELYEFNTTASPIGPVPAMSAIPLGSGTGVTGIVAISNDGARVYFVANTILAANANPAGHSALVNQPNLYAHDTASGHTTFVATLAATDVNSCKPTCAGGELTGLVSEPDTSRPAVPTPNGSILLFSSSNDLTSDSHTPTTTLTATANLGEHRISVTSTAGFLPKHTIAVDVAGKEELEEVETINSATELTVSEYGPGLVNGFSEEHAEGAPVVEVNQQLYRYDSIHDTLVCVSCTPVGVIPTASANLGETRGGAYAPSGRATPMSEDGSRIFFDSPDPLTPGTGEAQTNKVFEPASLYEWENDTVSLIADGSAAEAVLDGTTSSGNDVFFSSSDRLVASATSSSRHVYDARIDGGDFPEPAQPAAPCVGEACRPAGTSSTFFPLPGSATLGDGVTEVHTESVTPRFTVRRITARQRAALARSGHVTLTVSATAAGKIVANVTTKLRGQIARVGHAAGALRRAGTLTLVVTLSNAARAMLGKTRTLALTVQVKYSATSAIEVAKITLRSTRGI